jgi:RimJ/RimL family protein N-acetyltransferase
MSNPSLTLQVCLPFRLVATDLCPEPAVLTDGVVTLRPPRPGDAQLLIDGRDAEFFRWLGPGAESPSPVACVWVDDELVGWVDYDVERDWLEPGEVNVGYYLFPAARGKGYASRAVELLLRHLDRETEHTVATLLIDHENVRSLGLARRLGFAAKGEVEGDAFFVRDVRARNE